MTRDFAEIAYLVLEMVRKEKTIQDVLLMVELGFNPDNWRHWRAKLVELFEIYSYPKEDSGDKTRETVVYVKQQKLWTMKDVPAIHN